MFPEPTELLLIGCLIESIDPKNQLADILTKGNFTRDEWIHLLCLFNISHFSSTNCLEVMSKRTLEDAGEERVSKIKADDEFGLAIQRKGSERACLDCIESPGKTKSESQEVPLSSWNEQQPRTGRPVMGASSSSYSEWNFDNKCGNLVICRTQVRGDPNMTSLSSMMIWTLTPPQNRNFLQDHDHSCTE